MPVLRPGSRLTNVGVSLNAYILAALPGVVVLVPRKDIPDVLPLRWVELAYLPLEQRRTTGIVRVGKGHERELLVNCNCCEQVTPRRNNDPSATLYTLSMLVDTLYEAFTPMSYIPIRDYFTVGTPIVSSCHWRSIRQHEVPAPEGLPIEIRNVSVTLCYEEEYI